MKFFILSDIHGSKKYLDLALEKYQEEKCDYLVLLGDLLYHGPRNPLPEGYDPAAVAEALNPYKEKIIAVRGNCDSEVDQMVLDFPMMGDFQMLFHEDKKIFVTHGHLYNRSNMPKLSKGDVFIHGHFHLPMTERLEGVFYLNPGSISLPKNNAVNSYGIIDGQEFFIKDLEGNVVRHMQLLD
jgi:hypothetical protein